MRRARPALVKVSDSGEACVLFEISAVEHASRNDTSWSDEAAQQWKRSYRGAEGSSLRPLSIRTNSFDNHTNSSCTAVGDDAEHHG